MIVSVSSETLLSQITPGTPDSLAAAGLRSSPFQGRPPLFKLLLHLFSALTTYHKVVSKHHDPALR